MEILIFIFIKRIPYALKDVPIDHASGFQICKIIYLM